MKTTENTNIGTCEDLQMMRIPCLAILVFSKTCNMARQQPDSYLPWIQKMHMEESKENQTR